MRSPKGTWFTSQKDTPPLLPSNWWPQDYWLLTTDKERRKYGVPPIDHAIYTDKNSEVIIAYLHAYNAFGDSSYLAKARQATESLLASQLTREGWMQQVVRTEEIKQDVRLRHQSKLNSPLLIAQSRFGIALLKLHQETGEKRWLHLAVGISKSLLKNLYDHKNGGFWASTPTGDNPIGPRKPLEDNSVTAQFIYDLSVLSKDLSLAGIAEKTFRSVVSPNVLAREGKATGETALLAEKLAAEYVEYSVVTNDPTSEKSRSLHSIGRSIYHPRKIVHYEAPGRYPSFDEPVVFICSPNRCSLPLSSEEEIRKIAEVF